MTSSPKRRRSLRMRLGVPARLWHDVGWQQVWCEDVTEEFLGLSVFRSHPQRGERVRVTLLLPDGPLDVIGRVERAGPGRLAVRLDARAERSAA